jgi:hypothetical protein
VCDMCICILPIELVLFVKCHCHCDSELVLLACYGVDSCVWNLFCHLYTVFIFVSCFLVCYVAYFVSYNGKNFEHDLREVGFE